MKKFLLSAVCLVTLPHRSDSAEGYFFDANFIPDPSQSTVRVQIDVFDVDDPQRNLGHYVQDVSGTTWFRQPLTPGQNTRQVKVFFSGQPAGFRMAPPEKILDLSPKMHVRDVTWLPVEKDSSSAYLESLKKAEVLVKGGKDPDRAVAHAAYASALAETPSQRIEAGKVEAQANLAKNNPERALQVYSKTAKEVNFDTTGPEKKKAFVSEWFDTVETAAKAEGGSHNKKTGLILDSLPESSKTTHNFEELTTTLAKFDPSYERKATRSMPKQTSLLNSKVAAKENVVRAELSRNPYKSPQ